MSKGKTAEEYIFINPSIWEDAKFYKMPELPTIELKKDKVKYKITDLRYLNEQAVECVQTLINIIINSDDWGEVGFVATDMEKDRIHLIADIMQSIRYEYEKGGKNGYSGSAGFLVMGEKIEGNGKETKVTLHLNEEQAEIIHEYAQDKEELNFYELVIAVAEEEHRRLVERVADMVED